MFLEAVSHEPAPLIALPLLSLYSLVNWNYVLSFLLEKIKPVLLLRLKQNVSRIFYMHKHNILFFVGRAHTIQFYSM
jgi:hypothetical protein